MDLIFFFYLVRCDQGSLNDKGGSKIIFLQGVFKTRPNGREKTLFNHTFYQRDKG